MFSSILASNTAMLTGGKALPPDTLEPSSLWGGPGKPTDPLPETGPLPEKVEAKVDDAQDKNVFTKDENENTTIGTVIMDQKEVQVVEPKLELSGDKKTLYDYAEVQKWKDITSNKDDNANIEIICDTELRNEENLRNSLNSNDISSAPTLTCRSLNELISQVAELDEIYSDTHARLLSGGGIKASEDPLSQVQDDSQSPQIIEMDVEDLYDDNQTYSSLQMAMKNPIEPLDLVSEKYEDVIPQSPVISILPSPPSIQNNKREISASAASITTPETPDSKLPPLPPKRVRKSPPTPPARPEHLFPHETTPVLTPPNKTLPPPPEVSPAPAVKQSKPSLFQKLFSKKPGKSGKKEGSVTPRGGSISRQGSAGNVSQAGMFQSSSDVVESETSIIIPLTGPPELTEAEHYALYTDMAPHATVSEFDEMSFYYSPVEGGNIISQSESNISRISNSNRDILT
ncbi:embryonic polarity protein dorsal [Anabrus simplex]|uniref:embryonic polarity protein dorsal n=1 Tax=Anabrus simplex TaxID=316456 RepID=UPI0034DD761C